MTQSPNVPIVGTASGSGLTRPKRPTPLANLFTRLYARWISQSQSQALAQAIPAYRLACNNERVCQQRGNTKGIGRARRQKKAALEAALGRSVRIRVEGQR